MSFWWLNYEFLVANYEFLVAFLLFLWVFAYEFSFCILFFYTFAPKSTKKTKRF